MSYQKCILVGNLTKDGELKYSQSGKAIYGNSIAVTKKFTSNGEKKEKVMFIDITSFSRQAEICNQYLHKGSKVLLEGEIEFQQWVDQNGGKRSKHSFNVSTMQMLDSKNDNQQSNNSQANYQQPQQQAQQYQQPPIEYQNAQGQPVQQQQYQANQQQAQVPPAIDIDEDPIPF